MNGHYRKIDNLDDAFKAVVDKFAEKVEKDSALLGAHDVLEVNGRKFKIEVKEVKG